MAASIDRNVLKKDIASLYLKHISMSFFSIKLCFTNNRVYFCIKIIFQINVLFSADILKDADLANMTSKKVRRQLEEKYDVDLTAR